MRTISQHFVFPIAYCQITLIKVSMKAERKDSGTKEAWTRLFSLILQSSNAAKSLIEKNWDQWDKMFPLFIGKISKKRVDFLREVSDGNNHKLDLIEENYPIAINAWLVHRGVSQVKLSSPEDRVVYWEIKSVRKVPQGIDLFPDRIVVTPEGLEAMGRKGLVIMTNPNNPRVLTPKVIKNEGNFISAL